MWSEFRTTCKGFSLIKSLNYFSFQPFNRLGNKRQNKQKKIQNIQNFIWKQQWNVYVLKLYLRYFIKQCQLIEVDWEAAQSLLIFYTLGFLNTFPCYTSFKLKIHSIIFNARSFVIAENICVPNPNVICFRRFL